MNQPINNQQPQMNDQQPPASTPAASPAPMSPPPAPQASPGPAGQNMPQTPFEMPGGMSPTQMPQDQWQPMGQAPANNSGGMRTWILIVVLIVLLALGGVVFANYEGWINIGFLNNLFGKANPTTTTTNTATTTSNTTTFANDATRKADLAKLKDALKAYYQANQKYPISATVSKSNDPAAVLTVLVPTYIAALPTDPVSTQYYGYKSADGKTFELSAVLDDTTDPTGVKSGNYYLYKITDSSTETPSASTTTTTPAPTGTTTTQ